MYGFLLVLARVSGAIVFVPLPGFRDTPEVAKVALALSLTFCLFPMWPTPDAPALAGLQFVAWMLAEASLGLTIGLAIAFLLEGFQIGTQIIGLEAGYSYASTIDPSSQADSTVLQMMSQWLIGLLFFAMGMDRQIIGAFATSLNHVPPGTFLITHVTLTAISKAGMLMFTTGLRIALPVVALMLSFDIALALLGKIQAQLQVMTLAFPVKMLVALAMLAAMTVLMPPVLASASAKTWQFINEALGG